MQLQTPFDATLVDPTQGAGNLPVGRHPAVISGSEPKQNNAQDGGYLQFDLTIIDGPNKGQTGADRLNLFHTKQQVVEIAQKRLSAYCHVTNVFKVSDTAQLHNIPFLIEVGYQKGQGPDAPAGPENKGYTQVNRLFDMQGNEPGKKPANPAPQPQAQALAAPAQSFVPPTTPAQPAWGAPAAQAPAPTAAPAWGAQAQPNPASFPPPAAQAPAWNQAPAAGAPAQAPWMKP